ncbi:unnamed protein product [Sphagnum compactum]
MPASRQGRTSGLTKERWRIMRRLPPTVIYADRLSGHHDANHDEHGRGIWQNSSLPDEDGAKATKKLTAVEWSGLSLSFSREKNSKKEILVHSRNQAPPNLPLNIRTMGSSEVEWTHDSALADLTQRLETELEEKSIPGMNNEVEFSASAHSLLLKTGSENSDCQVHKNQTTSIQASPEAAKKKRYTKLDLATIEPPRTVSATLTLDAREAEVDGQKNLNYDPHKTLGSIGSQAARN